MYLFLNCYMKIVLVLLDFANKARNASQKEQKKGHSRVPRFELFSPEKSEMWHYLSNLGANRAITGWIFPWQQERRI